VLALLRLARLAEDDYVAQLPAELAAAVTQRLGRYVLRARLRIEPRDAAATPLPGDWPAARSRRADVAAGLPQVYAATSERFVAQMLNLDCLGAVSFTKGCYTGQEVIARAHYRGRVKRRMQRFALAAPAAAAAAAAGLRLTPGAALRLADGRRLELVDLAHHDDGHVELLAVAPLPVAADSGPGATAVPAAAVAEAEAAADAAPLPVLDGQPLPLPYALPD